MEANDSRRSPLAQSFEELGEGMRRLRSSRGWSRQGIVGRLNEIARREGAGWTLSAASIQRFETGRGQRPRLIHAVALDQAYSANHWILLSLAQLLGPVWQPWAEMDWPRNAHVVAWPSGITGPAWVHVWPSSRSIGLEHTFALTWLGDSRREHRVSLAPEGEYWVFMKPSVAGRQHADLEIVEPEHSFYVLHGLGLPPREDLRQTRVETGWSTT